jgi:predicted alpha-1,2-mannosidase
MRNRIFLFIFMFFISAGCSFARQSADKKTACTSYVDPFIGTNMVDNNSLSGSNFPGAAYPLGFVQLSPDTRYEVIGDPCSGYNYQSNTIFGFSHDHLSGTGVSDLFDVSVMPGTGPLRFEPGDEGKPGTGFSSSFSHQEEWAKPGYYKVVLKDYGVTAELSATEHCGIHRYTAPAADSLHVLFDLYHSREKGQNGSSCRIIGASMKVLDDRHIVGYRVLTGWARMRKVYFYAEFSRPFDRNYFYDGRHIVEGIPFQNGGLVRGAFCFSPSPDPLLLKVGISSVSEEGAKKNFEAEIAGKSFEEVSAAADAAWEKILSSISIEGTANQKKIFYTGLYHAFIQPNNTADVDGRYQAPDMTIRTAEGGKQYSTFSLWDTYRAANPLYALLKPDLTGEFVNSMIRQSENYGFLPIWQLWNDENYCMIGNHAIPIVVDAVLKKVPGVDPERAYAAVRASATVDHYNSPFHIYDRYGYMPEDLQSQSVSITLETCFDDWCVAELAKYLGKENDYEYFLKRSGYYRNLFDKDTGFFRGKSSSGKWLSPFDPLAYGGNGGNPYTEGNAWQYLWYVPENVPDLVNLLGGKASFVKKLDTFFRLTDQPAGKNGNASGFIGQYAHGNEPSHHIIYLYDFVGEPWKTQSLVAKVMKELYTSEPSGYCGNEDCGQMSAWYIFSSMGFYPFNPANGVYTIGSPVLKSAEIHLENGKTFRERAKNVSDKNIYIQSVKLNGKAYHKTYLLYTDIVEGGDLEFTMGAKPNKAWGTASDSAPVSGM